VLGFLCVVFELQVIFDFHTETFKNYKNTENFIQKKFSSRDTDATCKW